MSTFKLHRNLEIACFCILAFGIMLAGCGKSDEATGVVGLYPPQNLTATVTGATEILLAWTSPENAPSGTMFKVFRDGAPVVIVDGTQYTDRNLQAATTYTYTVRSIDALGSVSEPSSTVNATTQKPADVTPPATPGGLAAEPQSPSSISLTWTLSTGNVRVVGYRLFRDGVEIAAVEDPKNSYVDRNLSPATTYAYAVLAYDANGSVSLLSGAVAARTPEIDTVAPTAPASLSASAPDHTTIDLVWGASTDNVGVTWYVIYRDGARLGASQQTGYTDSGLEPNTTYTYTLTALDAAGNESPHSNPASAATPHAPDILPPTTPAELAATGIGPTTIDLVWEPSSDNDRVTWYRIYRDGVRVGTTGRTDYRSSGLEPNTTYAFTVTALDPAGNESQHSNQVSATTLQAPDILPPTTPGSLAATASGQTTIDLVWEPSTDNDRVTWYRIYRDGVRVGTTGNTHYRSAGLEPGTTYTFTVTAMDPAGNESPHSNQVSAATLPGLDTVAPSAPGSLSGSASGQTTVDLVWEPSTDNDRVTWYRIYRDGVRVGTTGNTHYRSAGLSPNTAYSYTVTAIDPAGNESPHSNLVSVTTLPTPDTQAPTSPSSLSATASGQTTIDLGWGQATDNDRVTWYLVYRNGVHVGTTGNTSYRSAGLSPNTGYTYTVTAIDPAGNESEPSNKASATTFPVPDTQAPTSPGSLSATGSGTTSINLVWEASTDNDRVTWYLIYRNGFHVGTTGNTSYKSAGLNPGTTYTYTVTALDPAGNESDPSNEASATTSE